MYSRTVFPTIEELLDLDYCTAALSKLKGVSFCSLNIRSLYKNYDSIRALLYRSEIDCLLLNETYLNGSVTDDELSVPGYRFIRFDRTQLSGKKSGGGVGAYVNTKYEFNLVTNSNICTPAVESFWIKLSLKCAHPTFIGCIYRPPDGSSKDFVETLEKQMESIIDDPASDIIIMGDVNIDVQKRDSHNKTLSNFINKHSLSQITSKPTRVTETTSSVIDHIYVNNLELYAHCGTLEAGLSDRSKIFVCRKRAKISKEKRP